MKGCDHDLVYSGQTNLSRRFACICRSCGEHWWRDDYQISQVNFDEYCRLRVVHGWATPRLPAPPRVPVVTVARADRAWAALGTMFFLALAALLGVAWVPWGPHGESMLPFGASLIGSGVALLDATLLYLVWKKGSHD